MGLALRYIQSINEKPIQTRLVTTSVSTISANVISQVAIENTSVANIDWQRLRKVLVASLVLSVVRHFQFQFINRVVPPSKGGISQIIQQLILDQLIFAPISNALFFILMALQNNNNVEQITEELPRRLWPTMKMYWKIWPAAKLISFAFVPVVFRPLFGDFIGFFWAIFLCGMTKRSKLKR